MTHSHDALDASWSWFEASEDGGVDGGAMAKLFRNNVGTLSDVALLARESVQNSWDAAQRMRKDDGDDVPFSVVFRFERLFGPEREAMIRDLDLHGLAERRAKLSTDPLVGDSILDHLDDPEVPLNLLYVEDRGTHGLFGHPRSRKKSHLYLAMYYLGGSEKDPGAGGSYGFGKSALQRASRVHSVIAHSAFRLHPEIGDDQQSRMVGFTWWSGYELDHKDYEGRGFLGTTSGEGTLARPAPYEGQAADLRAKALGFSTRDPADAAARGSSFLVVDCALEPADLLRELERWWWPAFEENLFDVTVVDADGNEHVPRPRDDPFIRQFLPAYRIARGLDDPQDPNKERRPSDNWRVRGEVTDHLGALGLVVPDEPRRFEGEDSTGEGYVALIRSPRMVINYEAHPVRRVPIRGVFVASSEANELLRRTEPAAHDIWSTRDSSDIPSKATSTARKLLRSIANDVKKMADEVAPRPPKEKQALRLFSQLLGGLLGSARGPVGPVPPGGEPFELRLVSGPTREVMGDGLLRLRARFATKLLPGAPDDLCEVAVGCTIYVEEDDRAGTQLALELTRVGNGPRMSFDDSTGQWVGDLGKADAAVFDVVSAPYSDSWTVQLQPSVTRLGVWGR